MNQFGVNRESISKLAEEAENKPVEFNPSERSAYIRQNIQQIRAMLGAGHSLDSVKSIFPEFSEEYPKLFEMVTRPGGFEEASLNLMINMLNKMGTGTSQHQASIKVGQYLMDKYVTPTLPPAPGAPNSNQ